MEPTIWRCRGAGPSRSTSTSNAELVLNPAIELDLTNRTNPGEADVSTHQPSTEAEMRSVDQSSPTAPTGR